MGVLFMAQYKIENKKLKMEIFGVVYEVRKPKYKEIIDMQDKMDAMSTKEKMLFITDNLVNYGIPREVVDELDSSSVVEILEIVNGTKKN